MLEEHPCKQTRSGVRPAQFRLAPRSPLKKSHQQCRESALGVDTAPKGALEPSGSQFAVISRALKCLNGVPCGTSDFFNGLLGCDALEVGRISITSRSNLYQRLLAKSRTGCLPGTMESGINSDHATSRQISRVDRQDSSSTENESSLALCASVRLRNRNTPLRFGRGLNARMRAL